MKIAFYKASFGTVLDKVISFVTRSPYSHCELVFSDGQCASSSSRDGGVRFKTIELGEKWDVYQLDDKINEAAANEWFTVNAGIPYDWIGAGAAALHIDLESPHKAFCSSACAQSLAIPSIVTPGALLDELIDLKLIP